MDEQTYLPPVSELLTLGACEVGGEWLDYTALGIGPEHIPELIRMAMDPELHEAYVEETGADAAIHAWRALGQLRAEAAIEPLVQLLTRIDDEADDWVSEEIPPVLERIGPAALATLVPYLADPSHGLWARVSAAEVLGGIGTRFPETRSTCVDALLGQLERLAENDPDLNAFLILPLTQLKAVEAAPAIERAFAADAVDTTVMGDWEDVQVELGLLERRQTPRNYGGSPGITDLAGRRHKADKQKKSKRKQQKKSRKINRKKKRR
jgi:HEAT repeat protein